MKEEELVDGAEYEGEQVRTGALVRGTLSLKHKWDHEDAGGRQTAALVHRVSGGSGSYVWLDSLRRVEPVAEKREWKVGDRVEWDDAKNKCGGEPGVIRGVIERIDSRGYADVRLDADCAVGRAALWMVNPEALRPAPAPIAEKARLFETGCCLCGSVSFDEELAFGCGSAGIIRECPGCNFLNLGARICRSCIMASGNGPDELKAYADGWHKCDVEITRRKALVSGSVGDTRCSTTCPDGRRCELKSGHDGLHRTSALLTMQPATTTTQQAEPERPKPDPYAAHRAKHDDHAVGILTALRDERVGKQKREAFRQLDRRITERKYVYAETSHVFSTATWESD